MPTKRNLLIRPLLIPVFAFSVMGLTLPARAAGTSDAAARSSGDHSGVPLKASDVIGLNLENNEGQKVGTVDDLAIDLQAGRVVQLIVSTGGFLSMGERHSAVPPGRVHVREQGKALHFDITREKLKSAPAFAMSDWDDFYQSDRVKESYSYYGEVPSFDAVVAGDGLPAAVTRANGLGHVQRATKLMGLTVENLANENIGEIENLIVDLADGRVVAVVVSSGGFLGMGDSLSVIPPTALRFNAEHDRLRLDTTKEALRDAPRFKKNEWPDFAQRDYTAGVYRAYKQEAYLGRDSDNAGRNSRDRSGQTLTPLDQGGNVNDVTLTQQIRKAVVGTDGLSVNAKNVKIITVKGRVTLRGPVGNNEEKGIITAIATRVAGASNVDDQLEITKRE